MVEDRNLARLVGELAARVERLEQNQATTARPAPDTAVVQRLMDAMQPDHTGAAGEATILYAGAGRWAEGTLAWQMNRTWGEIRSEAGEHSASLFSALANPTRVRIVAELLGGDSTTAALIQLLDQPSSGQLFHHLKELLAAGVIHQPVRGTYGVRKHHVIPLLTVLCAAADINPPAAHGDPV